MRLVSQIRTKACQNDLPPPRPRALLAQPPRRPRADWVVVMTDQELIDLKLVGNAVTLACKHTPIPDILELCRAFDRIADKLRNLPATLPALDDAVVRDAAIRAAALEEAAKLCAKMSEENYRQAVEYHGSDHEARWIIRFGAFDDADCSIRALIATPPTSDDGSAGG